MPLRWDSLRELGQGWLLRLMRGLLQAEISRVLFDRTCRYFVAIRVISLGLGALVLAQTASPESPDWAYGVPATPPRPAAADRASRTRRPSTSPTARRPSRWPTFATSSTSPTGFPNDHPAMPDVFVHGRPPDVRGCGMCHMPNGKGRPENAPLAGLPYAYVVQQLADFKNDLRTSADPRKTNTTQMIQAAKAMTDDEIKAAPPTTSRR